MECQRWLICGVVLVATVGAQAARARDGRPSNSDLAQMGLGGMAVMSDDEAMTVRGMGYGSGSYGGGTKMTSSVSVSGNSFATIVTPDGSAHSENAYSASGKNKAGGDNLSFAGKTVIITQSGGNKPPKGGNGGYPSGGDMGNKPPKGGNGGYPSGGGMGYKPPSGGNGGYPSNGGMGGKNGYPSGGGMGGNMTTSITFAVFAGGSSHAYAH